jgi:mannose-6-phosphate isomerase-like protein (cupin superfamily)
MASRHERNEASVLHFVRDRLADGVHVANIALRRGENSLFHVHTETRDTFYVMSGRLTVHVRVPQGAAKPGYRGLVSTPAEVTHGADGERTHRVAVLPGEVLVIDPGVVHCAMNLDDDACKFLCIEGVGAYDFVEV